VRSHRPGCIASHRWNHSSDFGGALQIEQTGERHVVDAPPRQFGQTSPLWSAPMLVSQRL
jgi:hypothetical protein